MHADISKEPFYLGDWCVLPELCRLQNNNDSHHLQPKLMEVLLYLAAHPMTVISTDKLIEVCWMGQPMTDNPIHKTIAQLRKALGDSSETPKYIKTVPRKGYMLIAKIAHGKINNHPVEPFWCQQVPFLGTKSFQIKHKDIYFGREQAIADLLNQLERFDQQDNVMINLSGVSGCGKSSFIQAGVIPRLLNPYKPFKFQYVDAVFWQACKENDVNSLIKAMYQKQIFRTVYSIDDIQQWWQQKPTSFNQCVNLENGKHKRIVLFIDQLEQWLTAKETEAVENTKLSSLLDFIVQLHSSQLFLIVISARDEAAFYIKNIPAYQSISTVVMDFRLPQMQASHHKNWIQDTMQASGLYFETNPNRQESLLDLLVHTIERHRFSLSTVQTVMLKLYEHKDNSKLQYESFHALGGIKGIIDQQVEAVFQSCTPADQQAIKNLFPFMVVLNSMMDVKAKQKKIPWAQATKALSTHKVTELIDQRLLFSEQLNEQTLISFNEPYLPQIWHTLSQWCKQNHADLLKQSEIQFMTARWYHHGKSDDYLLSTSELKQIDAHTYPTYILTNNENNFISRSKVFNHKRLKFKGYRLAAGVALVAIIVCLMVFILKTHEVQQKTTKQLNILTQHITNELNPELKEKGELKLLESLNMKLLRVFEQFHESAASQQQIIAHAAVLNVMGELSINHRKSAMAHDYFLSTEHIIKQSHLVREPELLAQLMLSQYWLGYLGFVDSNFSQAKTHWQSYLQTALLLRQLEPAVQKWQLEQSYALNNLGSLSERTGELDQAAAYFEQSIAIKKSLLSAQPDSSKLLADLADSLSWQGNIYRKQGALNQARKAYKNSAELTAQIKTKKGQNNIKLHRESLALHRMASVSLDLGEISEAQTLASSALDKSLVLNELEQQNNDYKKELISLYLFNANINRHVKKFDQSLMLIQRANHLIDYFKINLTMTSQVAAYQMLLKREQALIFEQFGQTESALTALEDGLTTWEDYELKTNQLAQVTYVMLHLSRSLMLKKSLSESRDLSHKNSIKVHLDKAWKEINQLLIDSPQSRQLMAIKVAVAVARDEPKVDQFLIQSLINSEYRNPEYYQPLVDEQLITFN